MAEEAKPVAETEFFVKTLDDVRKEGNVKVMKNCESRRYVTRTDGMGYSFHETVLYKGQHMFMCYTNHLETVFITKGSGWIEFVDKKEDLGKGKRYPLKPGTCYALQNHEKHWFGNDGDEDLHCLCAFTPPCTGSEVHNPEGAYPFIGDDGEPQYDYWQRMEAEGKPVTVQLRHTTPQS